MTKTQTGHEAALDDRSETTSAHTLVELTQRLYTVLGIPDDAAFKSNSDDSVITSEVIKVIFSKLFGVDFSDYTSAAAQARAMVRYLSDMVLNSDLDYIMSSDIVTGIDGGRAKRFMLELLWEIAIVIQDQENGTSKLACSKTTQIKAKQETRDIPTDHTGEYNSVYPRDNYPPQWSGVKSLQRPLAHNLVGGTTSLYQTVTPDLNYNDVTPFSKGQHTSGSHPHMPSSQQDHTGMYNQAYVTSAYPPIIANNTLDTQNDTAETYIPSRRLFQDRNRDLESNIDGQFGMQRRPGDERDELRTDLDDERGVNSYTATAERVFQRTSSELVGVHREYDPDAQLHTLPRIRPSHISRHGVHDSRVLENAVGLDAAYIGSSGLVDADEDDRIRDNYMGTSSAYTPQRSRDRYARDMYDGFGGELRPAETVQTYRHAYNDDQELDGRAVHRSESTYDTQLAATQRRMQQQQEREMRRALQRMKLGDGTHNGRRDEDIDEDDTFQSGVRNDLGVKNGGDDASYSTLKYTIPANTRSRNTAGYDSGFSQEEEAELLRREIQRMQQNIACLAQSREGG